MTKTLRSTLAAGGLLLLSALPALAAPSPANRVPHCNDFRAIARFLHLTAEQLASARTLGEALRSTVRPLNEAIVPLRENLEDLLDAASPNASTVGGVVIQIDALHDQIRAAREDYEEDFAALLTPTQLVRYQNILARCNPD